MLRLPFRGGRRVRRGAALRVFRRRQKSAPRGSMAGRVRRIARAAAGRGDEPCLGDRTHTQLLARARRSACHGQRRLPARQAYRAQKVR